MWHILQKGIVAGDVQGAPGSTPTSKDNLMFLTETPNDESCAFAVLSVEENLGGGGGGGGG